MTRGKIIGGGVAAAVVVAAIVTPLSVISDNGNNVTLTNTTWICRGPVNIDTVKVMINDGSAHDGVHLDTGCTGRIGYLDVDIVNGADGVKVNNGSLHAAHDLTVEGGHVTCEGHPVGAHQDGLQAMGGGPVLFQHMNIQCPGALGAFAISKAGGMATTPHGIVCENCTLGPLKGLRIGNSMASGARNTTTCGISITPAAVAPVRENVTVLLSRDPGCTP